MAELILSIEVSFGWFIQQIDVQNAFLHGPLSKKVYMAQTLSTYVYPQFSNYVNKLNKEIYGLK